MIQVKIFQLYEAELLMPLQQDVERKPNENVMESTQELDFSTFAEGKQSSADASSDNLTSEHTRL